MTYEDAIPATESPEQPVRALPDATGASEALVQQIAEAIHESACGLDDCDVCIRYPEAEDAARAVLPLVEAQVAPLRDALATAREDKVEFARWRDKWVADMQALETKLARSEDATLAAESALRQVRELAEARDVQYPAKFAFGAAENHVAGYRAAQADLLAVLDSALVGAADTQPEGTGGIVTPAGITPGGMQVCPDCGRWGLNPAGLCVNNFHDAAHATPTAGGKVDTAPEADEATIVCSHGVPSSDHEHRCAEQCGPSQRADGKHSWKFDGDDPYIECHYCHEVRDALTGRVVRPADTAPESGEGR